MTFRHSFSISVFIHLLIFGSAIAVAQFAGGSYLHNPDSIMVSIVSSGAQSGKGRIPSSSQRVSTQQKEDQPDAIPQLTHAEKQNEQAIDPSDHSSKNDHAENEGRAPGASVGGLQDTNGPHGVISREEWAILVSAIDRSKSYPRLARERGIEGVVRLRFKLATSGVVDKIEIIESSGHEILDNASIRAVYRASPLPYVKGWVEVPIAYVLN